MAMDELTFVNWLRERLPRAPQGIGDDMAVVEVSGRTLLFSSDMLLDGRHFDTGKHPHEAIGRKAVNCCLSDCAATAVRPVAVTLSVALSEATTDEQAKALINGALEAASVFEVQLAGGDTTRWPAPLAIDVAVVAEPFPGIRPILRSGAKAGDSLYVTGPLGGSSLGRHLAFTPRIHEARALATALGDGLHALIDITDGLSLDLWRVCEASSAGATLDEALIEAVTSEDATAVAERDGTSPIEHVLADGEDFELLLAVADTDAATIAIEGAGIPLYRVGTMTTGGFALREAGGRTSPLQPRGYVH